MLSSRMPGENRFSEKQLRVRLNRESIEQAFCEEQRQTLPRILKTSSRGRPPGARNLCRSQETHLVRQRRQNLPVAVLPRESTLLEQSIEDTQSAVCASIGPHFGVQREMMRRSGRRIGQRWEATRAPSPMLGCERRRKSPPPLYLFPGHFAFGLAGAHPGHKALNPRGSGTESPS